MAFHIPVGTLPGLRDTTGITVKSYLAGYQYMMFHNLRNAHLQDVKVRKALDIVIDRSALTQAVKGGMGTRSFFPENTPYYLKDKDHSGDKAGADKLLDEAGWVKGADGMRAKDGTALTIKLVAYPQRPSLVAVQPTIAKAIESLGIKVTQVVTSADSWDELDAIIADKSFDLLMWAQHTLPAGDPQFFINHFFRSDGGGNHAGFADTDVDTVIDALSHAEKGDARIKATATAHQAILDHVPVSILFTPSWHVGLGSKMADYTPYGSDYYVIHPDVGLSAPPAAPAPPPAPDAPMKTSQTFLAGGTDPTKGSTGWALTSHGISEKLFTVDSAGNVVSQVARSIKKLDKFSWELLLKADYKFSDGTPVTAKLVGDCLTKQNEVNSGAQASLGKMTMTVIDDMKLKIVSEKPTPVMEAVLAEWAFPVFLEKNGGFLFTGPYVVDSLTKDACMMSPNPYYPQADQRGKWEIHRIGDGEKAAADLKAGKLDMAFHIPVGTLPGLRDTTGITVKSYLAGYQYMMFHNLRNAHLQDVKVRKALDIVIDRSALTQAVKGGMGTRSFFPENTPYYLKDKDHSGDKAGADKLLDEAGWVKGADGMRAKDGTALTIKLVAYPQRPSLVAVQPTIAKAIESLGIKVTQVVTSADSWDELDAIIADKSFDLLMWAQHTLPAGDPQFFINHFFRSDGGGNHAGFADTDVDTVIDALSHAEKGDARIKATATAHQAILDHVPVSILFTPSWHVGLGPKLADYAPYGSDYYVIHADVGLKSKVTATTGPTITDETVVSGGTTAPENAASGAYQMVLNGLSVATALLLGAMF